MELDPSSPMGHDAHPADTERVRLDPMEPVKMEEDKETGMEGRLEDEEDEEEEGAGPAGHLTSSRMGNVSAIESSQMFLSLLAEGSSIRYDSSMQVCVSNFIQAEQGATLLFLYFTVYLTYSYMKLVISY